MNVSSTMSHCLTMLPNCFTVIRLLCTSAGARERERRSTEHHIMEKSLQLAQIYKRYVILKRIDIKSKKAKNTINPYKNKTKK